MLPPVHIVEKLSFRLIATFADSLVKSADTLADKLAGSRRGAPVAHCLNELSTAAFRLARAARGKKIRRHESGGDMPNDIAKLALLEAWETMVETVGAASGERACSGDVMEAALLVHDALHLTEKRHAAFGDDPVGAATPTDDEITDMQRDLARRLEEETEAFAKRQIVFAIHQLDHLRGRRRVGLDNDWRPVMPSAGATYPTVLCEPLVE